MGSRVGPQSRSGRSGEDTILLILPRIEPLSLQLSHYTGWLIRVAATEEILHNNTHTTTCTQKHAHNMHTTYTKQHAHNNMHTTYTRHTHNNTHTTTCTQHAHNNMHTTTCTQHAHNMHTTTCSQQHAHNNMHTTTYTQQHAHNNMHATTCSQQHAHKRFNPFLRKVKIYFKYSNFSSSKGKIFRIRKKLKMRQNLLY
jgi:hypothetical protein